MNDFNMSYQSLKEQLKAIYANNADAGAIETHLNEALANLDENDRREALDRLIREFEPDTLSKPLPPAAPVCTTQERTAIDEHLLARVIKLLLGRTVSQADMNAGEPLENLAESINTVLKALNQLSSTINTTLVGKQDSDQPIRQVIGYYLEGASHGQPLDVYISQIDKVFHESQQASRQAAHAKVEEILNQLSPEKIAQTAGASRLSPMKKSKYYDEYVHKFEKIENWFASGRFMESFLREFERN
ncbi:MAG: hypothetical protein MI799_14735, partial [Desulfobacterales bacterium]|nr:hypothetical protein [Desulfobacterales bacterium]